MDARVAVLASGSGTNLQALLDDPVVRPCIALVVSDQEGARALRRARDAGVRAVFVDPALSPDREAYGRTLLEQLQGEGIEHGADNEGRSTRSREGSRPSRLHR